VGVSIEDNLNGYVCQPSGSERRTIFNLSSRYYLDRIFSAALARETWSVENKPTNMWDRRWSLYWNGKG